MCIPHVPSSAPLPLTPDPKEGEAHKWPGDAKPFFRATNAAIRAHLARGNAVVVHCMASLSRSICFICAYLMECERLTLLQVPPPLPIRPSPPHLLLTQTALLQCTPTLRAVPCQGKHALPMPAHTGRHSLTFPFPSLFPSLPSPAPAQIKRVWDATWPNDHFLRELQVRASPPLTAQHGAPPQ